jgi:hypothetical protein
MPSPFREAALTLVNFDALARDGAKLRDHFWALEKSFDGQTAGDIHSITYVLGMSDFGPSSPFSSSPPSAAGAGVPGPSPIVGGAKQKQQKRKRGQQDPAAETHGSSSSSSKRAGDEGGGGGGRRRGP